MQNYIAFDGGGTKLKVIVYDETLRILAYKKSGGINGNFYTPEEVTRHVEEAFGGAIQDSGVTEIQEAYGVFVGDSKFASDGIHRLLPNCTVHFLGEGCACLLAACMRKSGCVILSGTGSGAIWIDDLQHIANIGGKGAYIGDEGSGYWMGQQGIQAAIRCIEGWGDPTLLAQLYHTYADMENTHSIGAYFYRKSDTLSIHMKISGFTHCVEEACNQGDKIALGIVKEAGELLAKQAIALYRKEHLPSSVPAVLCGGAWNTSPLIQESFQALFSVHYPDTEILSSEFSPVVAGVIYRLLQTGEFEAKKEVLYRNFKEM